MIGGLLKDFVLACQVGVFSLRSTLLEEVLRSHVGLESLSALDLSTGLCGTTSLRSHGALCGVGTETLGGSPETVGYVVGLVDAGRGAQSAGLGLSRTGCIAGCVVKLLTKVVAEAVALLAEWYTKTQGLSLNQDNPDKDESQWQIHVHPVVLLQ
ncbi:hypothetical protein RvY_06260 [Ramazzottius varieornatus]|uniref:Uncharacterized protein n=1 Tax=Ramazzottius varieornatus TaxID=947166 RepID=A0A1D1V6N8_RAMVA|nr:hypothetical protein RvY_06260 [Ramazzottius varieornatus]